MILVFVSSCQQKTYQSDFANGESREQFRQEWQKHLQEWAGDSKPMEEKTIKKFAWGTMALKLDNDLTDTIIKGQLDILEKMPDALLYDFLLNIYARDYVLPQRLLIDLQEKVSDARTIALLAAYAQKLGDEAAIGLKETSPYFKAAWHQNDALLIEAINWNKVRAYETLRDHRNIWMFLPKNRKIAGRALIQEVSGQWWQQEGQKPYFEYLGLSASNAPYYLANGNTPAGIYRIVDRKKSENIFIGPVPVIVTGLPYEIDYNKFTSNAAAKGQWSFESYQKLIPNQLMSFSFMNQAYLAGKSGRSEVIIHGSTIDPEFFKDETYYPLTPSLGCMCAKEVWNKDGILVESEQLRLLQAFEALSGRNGYLIVIQADVESSEQLEEQLDKYLLNEKQERHKY